jgi:hypothetical protein
VWHSKRHPLSGPRVGRLRRQSLLRPSTPPHATMSPDPASESTPGPTPTTSDRNDDQHSKKGDTKAMNSSQSEEELEAIARSVNGLDIGDGSFDPWASSSLSASVSASAASPTTAAPPPAPALEMDLGPDAKPNWNSSSSDILALSKGKDKAAGVKLDTALLSEFDPLVQQGSAKEWEGEEAHPPMPPSASTKPRISNSVEEDVPPPIPPMDPKHLPKPSNTLLQTPDRPSNAASQSPPTPNTRTSPQSQSQGFSPLATLARTITRVADTAASTAGLTGSPKHRTTDIPPTPTSPNIPRSSASDETPRPGSSQQQQGIQGPSGVTLPPIRSSSRNQHVAVDGGQGGQTGQQHHQPQGGSQGQTVQVTTSEPPFDFQRFLDQLRSKSAEPVAKYLRSYVTIALFVSTIPKLSCR